MGEIFYKIYQYFYSHKAIFVGFVLLTFFASLFLASRIQYEENIAKLLPDYKNMDKLSLVYRNNNYSDKIIVNISFTDSSRLAPDELINIGDSLTKRLESDLNQYIKKITYEVNPDFLNDIFTAFYANLPIYLDSADYKKIDSLLAGENTALKMDDVYRTITSPVGASLSKFLMLDPLGITFLAVQKLNSLQEIDDYTIYNSRIFAKDKKNLLMFISSANPSNETSKNSELIVGIDKIKAEIITQNKSNINIDYYGLIPVSVGNARQLKQDIILTVFLSFFGIILINFVAFRSIKAAFLAFLPAVYGGAIALGMIYILKGHISAISLGIGSIILGIIVDYSLYVISYYQQKKSIETVVKDMSFTIIVCALTTVAAFFCLLFVKSIVLHDLGLFAGFSLIGAAFFAIAILPHLIKNVSTQKPDYKFIQRITSYKYDKNKILILIIFILTIISIFYAKKVLFEPDLSKMNFVNQTLATAENKITNVSGSRSKTIFLISIGNSLQDALAKNEYVADQLDALKNSKVVKSYSGLNGLILSDSLQTIKINRWNKYWTEAKKAKLKNIIAAKRTEYKFKPQAFSEFLILLDKSYQPIDTRAVEILNSTNLQDKISFIDSKVIVSTIIKADSVNKAAILSKFDSNPDSFIFDKQQITRSLVSEIKSDFETLVNLSLIIVTIILILSFGRIETGLIASVPMFLSWLITLGYMGATGTSFNIFNIIISTFIFGLGVDYSVLMMRGLTQKFKTGIDDMPSYRKAILTSSATTIVGVAVLGFAKHPSLNSIYLISIIGMVAVVIISYAIEPLLFNQITHHRGKKRFLPMTLLNGIGTLFTYVVFFTGSMLGIVVGFLLFGIIRTKSSFNFRKKIFHQVICFLMKIAYYNSMYIPKKLHGFSPELLDKPKLIICNHQSHVDLLFLLSISPKIAMLTNDWVWNSPVFGRIVKFLEFYPTKMGIENSFEKLTNLVSQGYSILVFPEGTRSQNYKLQRFHKGAFFIAETMKLDILPIMLHGTGRSVTKGEILVRRGIINNKFLQPIKYEDYSLNKDYREVTKDISAYYKEEFAKFSAETEGPLYFKDVLIKNYIYKGPVLEWYLRSKLSMENNYAPFHEQLPMTGKILDVGCGYGFMTYMLGFLSDKREMIGIDIDQKKIETADNCHYKPDNVKFHCIDGSNFVFDKYDGIILSDILHYISQQEQRELVNKCMNSLNIDGVLVLRDSVSDLEGRQKISHLSEFFSTNFGFNQLASGNLYYNSKQDIFDMFVNFNCSIDVIDNAKYTSNLTFVIKKKAL